MSIFANQRAVFRSLILIRYVHYLLLECKRTDRYSPVNASFRISGFVIFGWTSCLFSFLQPMGCQILSAPPLAWAAPPVPNLSLHHHLMPTARNTDGKKAQASPNRMAFLQGMKVKGCKTVQVCVICTKKLPFTISSISHCPIGNKITQTPVVYWISGTVLAFVGLFKVQNALI